MTLIKNIVKMQMMMLALLSHEISDLQLAKSLSIRKIVIGMSLQAEKDIHN